MQRARVEMCGRLMPRRMRLTRAGFCVDLSSGGSCSSSSSKSGRRRSTHIGVRTPECAAHRRRSMGGPRSTMSTTTHGGAAGELPVRVAPRQRTCGVCPQPLIRISVYTRPVLTYPRARTQPPILSCPAATSVRTGTTRTTQQYPLRTYGSWPTGPSTLNLLAGGRHNAMPTQPVGNSR